MLSISKNVLRLPGVKGHSFYAGRICTTVTNLSKSESKVGTSSTVEDYRADEHEFTPCRAREVVNNSVTFVSQSVRQRLCDPGQAAMSAHQASAPVSLSSVMQSNVPQPYHASSHKQLPTHLNMPGGGLMQGDKYVSSRQQAIHPTHHCHQSSYGCTNKSKK